MFFWLSAWWALRLPWWPPAECSNVSMSCEYWYLQNVFLFLYHCCILSEIKLTTTTTKSRSHENGILNCRIALKFDRHIGSTTAEVPVKFQSDRKILHTNLAASRLYEILRKYVFSDIETGPWTQSHHSLLRNMDYVTSVILHMRVNM